MLANPERLEAFERRTDLAMLVLSIAFVALLLMPWLAPRVAAIHPELLGAIEWLIWGISAAEPLVRGPGEMTRLVFASIA